MVQTLPRLVTEGLKRLGENMTDAFTDIRMTFRKEEQCNKQGR
jgi:hypothetical protein